MFNHCYALDGVDILQLLLVWESHYSQCDFEELFKLQTNPWKLLKILMRLTARIINLIYPLLTVRKDFKNQGPFFLSLDLGSGLGSGCHQFWSSFQHQTKPGDRDGAYGSILIFLNQNFILFQIKCVSKCVYEKILLCRRRTIFNLLD